jgi:DNA primase
MDLPPEFLDDLRERVRLTSIVGRKLSWDQRKSNKGRGGMWAPCPFHQEKTASFYVDDRKGVYYCFGCKAKGDAISFLKDHENLSFSEAVEFLAAEAGMKLPEPDLQIQERRELSDVMEKAVRFFRGMLKSSEGSKTADYLETCGISLEMQDAFDLGYAPADRNALFKALTDQGVTQEQFIKSGICIKLDDDAEPNDRFRNCLIFPIRDVRGRCIAFGGRAFYASRKTKNLKFPETMLFDKGKALYNHGPARSGLEKQHPLNVETMLFDKGNTLYKHFPARSGLEKQHPLIVAENQMDVIALAQAGFSTAVAPLGTSITENQLMLMWRMYSEPIIVLDGDAAAMRAAYRLIDVALPLLKPGHALRFAIIPKGQNLDDLIRSGGKSAFQELLDKTIPMVELMWRQATAGQVFDRPGQMLLNHAFLKKIRNVKNPILRQQFEYYFKDKVFSLYRKN